MEDWRNMQMNKYIPVSIDTETTGLIPGKHEIVQLAIIPYDVNFRPIGRFVSYIKPMRPWTAQSEALAINNLDLKGLEEQPTPSQVRESVLNWKSDIFGECIFTPLGHNYASFDSYFLKHFFDFPIYEKHFDYKCEDSCILARVLVRKGCLEKASLDYLATFFKIERNHKHDAYDDALVTIKVYQKLLELIKI
jgi:DNA polymerase III subunit alpha, Gram-positive type